MSRIHLTPGEAKRLGINVPGGRIKTTSKAVPVAQCAATRCCTCKEVFETQAAEDRHFDQTKHRRYEMVDA